MTQKDKYNPPACPTLLFFKAKAIKDFVEQGIVNKENNKILAGTYNLDPDKINPIKLNRIDNLISTAGSDPERILVVPTYAEQIKTELPLLQGNIIIYPTHDEFSIRNINHPIQGMTYFTPLSEIDKKYHIKYEEDEAIISSKHDNRVEFIQDNLPFDPIKNGYLTWDSAYPILRNDGKRDLYLVISVDGPNIKPKRENRGLKEIRRVARNKKSKIFQDFLDRLAIMHNEVTPYLAYCDEWAKKKK